MKISVLTKDACFYNPSTQLYHTISGLQSLCTNPKKEKQIGIVGTLGYHEHICGVN